MRTLSDFSSFHADGARFAIRRMLPDDVERTLGWAADEGWNPGLDDAPAFRAADPDGFFIGTLDDEPVASISAVAYGDALGFIGLYIVRPEWRGKGFGMRLWQTAIDYLGARNIALDGVLAQQANYRKSGFVLAHRNVRYEGIATNEDDAGDDIAIVDALRVPFEHLLAYDTHHFCAARPTFLRAWLDAPRVRAFAAFDGDTLRGYGAIRACRDGYKISPLFAANRRIARALFHAMASTQTGEKIVIDVPEINSSAVALAVEHDMTSAFETARMYTRTPPDMPMANVYGVTSLELG